MNSDLEEFSVDEEQGEEEHFDMLDEDKSSNSESNKSEESDDEIFEVPDSLIKILHPDNCYNLMDDYTKSSLVKQHE